MALIGLGVVCWFVLPGVVKSQIERRGTEFLERPVTLERVSLNPFTLTVELEGLAISDRDGGELLGWQRLMVNADLWSTLGGSWGADAVELAGLRGRLFMTETGELNIADILAKLEEGEEDESRPLEVGRLEVVDAQLSLADSSRSRPFATKIGPLTFSVTDFHTKFDPEAPYRFEARTESGETLSWRGALSLVPLKSEGDFVVSGLKMPKYEAYFAELIPFEIEAGLVSASGRYALDWIDELPELKMADGAASVTGLVVSARDGQFGQQTLASIEVKGIEADLLAGRLVAAEIALADGSVDLRRTANGIDLMGFALGGSPPEQTTSTTDESVLQDVRVEMVRIDRIRYRLRDETLSEPTELGLNIDSARLQNVQVTDLGAPIELQLQANFPLGGTLAVSGEVSVDPLLPNLSVKLADLSLMAGADHVRDLTGLELVRGRVNAAGKITGGAAGLGFVGDATLSDLAVLDLEGEALLGLSTMETTGINLRISPAMLTVDAVRLDRPEAHIRILADGSINVINILTALSAAPAETGVRFEETAPPILKVGEIQVEGGRFTMRDTSLPQAVAISVDEFSGALEGWSSEDVARAKVDLTAKINGVAPMVMSGDLNPLGRPAHADLTVDVDRMDLLPTSGYVGKYAGYELESGKLSLDIAFQLRDRSIESDTMTVLDQFTLGVKTDSADATKLPVKLGVALLKDPAGEIVIDVPVAGNLDDPEFRISRVVWRVITNLLTKAATSPFGLLGGVIGGGEKIDLEHHVFSVGEAEVSAEAMKSLDALFTALQARPELSIGVRGEYDSTADVEARRPVVLENSLRARAPATAFAPNGDWQPYAREEGLVTLYEQVFGTPPVDPAGVVPPAEVKEEAVVPDPPVSLADEDPREQTLVAWLRRVFVGGGSGAPDRKPAASAPPQSSFPLPEGLEPELPVLPMAEIEARLVNEIAVAESDLKALAEERGQAARDYLVQAGLAAERIAMMDAAAGEAQVTLELR